MATETDAARDRVLAARAALGEELETLEASARAAVDIPAKIKRSPAKAAAVAGGAAFLVLGGPKRVFRAGKRAVTGEPEPLPPSMLPEEIDKSLRALGDDGEKVRGALERDFAAYAKQAGQGPIRTADPHRADRRPAAPVRCRQGRGRPVVQHRRRRFPGATRQDPRRAKRQSGGEGESGADGATEPRGRDGHGSGGGSRRGQEGGQGHGKDPGRTRGEPAPDPG